MTKEQNETKKELIQLAEKILPALIEIRELKSRFFQILMNLDQDSIQQILQDPEIQEIEEVLNEITDQILNANPDLDQDENN